MKTTLLATHFNIYLNSEASLHSIITVICMDPYSLNKLIATKYCFLILGDDTSFFFLMISLFSFFIFFCYFTLLLVFTKIILFLLLFFYLFIFHENPFNFLCSGMFRHVAECSVFRVLSTPNILNE